MFRKLRRNILLKIIMPLVDLVYQTKSMYWLKKIEELNTLSNEEINDWQIVELKKFIYHAYNHTVYYKELFDKIGIKPSDISSVSDLAKIPRINKEIIRENYEKLIPDNINKLKYRKSRSGGTTGEPLIYLCDENTWGYATAAKIYAWEKTDYVYGDNYIALGSTSLFPSKKKPIKNILYFIVRNGISLNGMNISNEIAEKYVNIIKDKRIKYIYGYTSSIYMLAIYILGNNIKIENVKWIFTTSEVLTLKYREAIQKAFNAKILDGYGARDAGITAYELVSGEYFVGYNVIAELVNNFEPNTGTLLSTNFINYSFPLIRYQLGDEVELENNSKYYNGQVIKRIIGRTSDVMRLDNGHNLSSTGFSIMMKEFNVIAFRMIRINGLTVRLEIQPKDTFSKSEENIIVDTMKKYLGHECKIDLIYVEKFEKLANGKWNYFCV